jgi:hypothetical protein
MDLSDRKATASLQLAKVWLVFSLLVPTYRLFSDGLGWDVIGVVIPGAALFTLVYRYPGGRYFVVGLLSLHAALLSFATVWVTITVAKGLYIDLVLMPEKGFPRPSTWQISFALNAAAILLAILLVGFLSWLAIDISRNDRVKKYFVSGKDLARTGPT